EAERTQTVRQASERPRAFSFAGLAGGAGTAHPPRLHIDLPIALGVLGGFVASVIASVRGTGEVYFDTVSILVFLLLIGRIVQRRGQQWALSRTDLLQLLLPARARRVL